MRGRQLVFGAVVHVRHAQCVEAPAQRLQRFGKLGTIDLRIDYLRPGIGEYFDLQAEVLRLAALYGPGRSVLLRGEGPAVAGVASLD